MYISEAASTNQLLSSAKRLVVLVPDRDLDEVALGRRIWDLARSRRIDVTYLCVVQHWGDEVPATHRLMQLRSVTNDPMFRTEILVKAGTSWSKAIREIQRPGDVIICDETQTSPNHVSWKKPLNRGFFDRLHIPVLTIPLI